MEVLGIVTEYNPFHNGHLYHLKKSKEITKATAVICVMSGPFLQRGEPALLDKWARTRMALAKGVDLILEIPYAYATRSAEAFAFGAIRLLEATGLIKYLSFGSELGDLSPLQKIARTLVEEPPTYKKALTYHLKEGLSFPKSRNLALKEEGHLSSILENPNNILGIEYLKALSHLKSTIEVITIQRLGSNYHDEKLTGHLSSATAIRKCLRENSREEISLALPIESLKILKEEEEKGRGPVFYQDLTPYLFFLLRSTDTRELKEILGVEEGLENRLKKAIEKAVTLEDLLTRIKTRRYTLTRIQRILIHLLNKYQTREAIAFDQGGGPRYLRVLGCNRTGQELLKEMKEKAYLPTITRVAPFYQKSFGRTRRMLELDILASDLYGLLFKGKGEGLPGEDFRKGPIIEHL